MSQTARDTASRAQDSTAFRVAARLGYAVNGLLNIVIGGIALSVAGTGATGSANPDGALTGLAEAPGGQVLIWVIAVGTAALGLWELASAILRRSSGGKRAWADRAKHIGKAITYLAISSIAVRVALSGSGGGGSQEEDLTSTILANPGGVVLVVLIGLLALGVGGYMVAKGARRKFLQDVAPPAGAARKATTALGIVGYIARGIAIAVIGILFITAGFTANASEAGGLDDALAALAALPFGQIILVCIGIGFIAYGIYSVVRARYARL